MPDQLLQDVFNTVRHDFQDSKPPSFAQSNAIALDGMLMNCFTHSTITNQIRDTWIQKRPGMIPISIDFSSILGAVAASPVANLQIVSLNDVYVAAVFDSTNNKYVICQYRPVTGTTVKVGEITGATANGTDNVFLTELTIAAVPTLGVIWNKADGTTSKGYYATSGATGFGAASLTEIVDVDFPPKRGSPLPLVGPMVQMNGTTYVMTNTGEIANSDLNSITSWNTLGTIQAISYPDQGVGLVRYKHHLVAFGEDSVEFFNDIGNPAPKSPLARTEQAFIKFGALDAKAILVVDDTLFWIAHSSSGTTGLWKLEGYTPTKVSGPFEDYAISFQANNYPIINGCLLSCITMQGKKHISLGGVYTSPWMYAPSGSNVTGNLMYNVEEKEFWCFYNGQLFREALISVSQYQLSNKNADDQFVLIGVSSGIVTQNDRFIKIYQLGAGANTLWYDKYGSDVATTVYPMFIQTNPLEWSTEKRKRIHKWKVISQTGTSGTAGTDEFAYLKGTYDDSTNQLSAVQRRTGTYPNTAQRYYISNLGLARRWQFGWTVTVGTNVRVKCFEFDISQNAH